MTTTDMATTNKVCDTIYYTISTYNDGYVLVACRSLEPDLELDLELGHVLGVCAILIGDDKPSLRDELRRNFIEDLIETFGQVSGQVSGQTYDDVIEGITQKIVNFINNPAKNFGQDSNIRLDIRGTEFQKSVWATLREIPVGGTASYAEIAKKLGLTGGARAIAGACAANVLAVVIPCHRVIKSDGAISGYRWGVERKRKLLALEASLAAITSTALPLT